MPTPFFADLGKKARNILMAGYYIDVFKVDCQKKIDTGLVLNTGCALFHKTNNFNSYLGTSISNDNFALGGKCSANITPNIVPDVTPDVAPTEEAAYIFDGTLSGNASVSDNYLKFMADCVHNPKTGSTFFHLKNAFRDDHVSFNLNTEINHDGPFIIDAAIVLEHEGFYGGLEIGMNTQTREITKNNLACEYTLDGYTFYAKVDADHLLSASCSFKTIEAVESAINVAWSTTDMETSITLGATYEVEDRGALVGAKVNNFFGCDVSYQQRLRDCVTFTLSAMLDCRDLRNYKHHKIGCGIQIDL